MSNHHGTSHNPPKDWNRSNLELYRSIDPDNRLTADDWLQLAEICKTKAREMKIDARIAKKYKINRTDDPPTHYRT